MKVVFPASIDLAVEAGGESACHPGSFCRAVAARLVERWDGLSTGSPQPSDGDAAESRRVEK
jgi:hypothetical protein